MPADEVFRVTAVARGCTVDLMDKEQLAVLVREAAVSSGLCVVAETTYSFVPHGVSVALLLAQSHLVVSTWPEYAAVTVDISVCSGWPAARSVWQIIRDRIRPGEVEVQEAEVRIAPLGSGGDDT
jgi:S-adenosylmethionine decarboxylase